MGKVNEKQFLRTITRHWMAGSTLTAAAADLNITVASASSRLKHLRMRGVANVSGWGIPRRQRKVAARKSVAKVDVATVARPSAQGWVFYVGHPAAV
jgi:hypothetical protein